MTAQTQIDALNDALFKTIGDNHAEQAVTRWIDTGNPELNRIISGSYEGGLPFGRMIEVFGESSTGKTANATQWMVAAQKMGGCAIFIDWERSFDVGLAEGFGLNTERPYWIYAKPKTWEEGNTLAAKACQLIRSSKVIPDDAPILVVFDSIAAALPQSQATKEIDEYTMNDTTALARATSSTLKSMSHRCEEFGATFVYLNQMRLKPGVMFGDPRTTPGGKSMEFFASARLALGRQKIMDSGTGKDKEFVGQNISVQCVKTKFTRPFQDCTLRMMYNDMDIAYFDQIASTLDLLIKNNWIEYNKPRVTWTDGKKYFVKELVAKLNAEPNGMEQLKALLPKSNK